MVVPEKKPRPLQVAGYHPRIIQANQDQLRHGDQWRVTLQYMSVSQFSQIQVRRLDPEIPLPVRAHPGDAGADLCATEDISLAPGQRALVGTGIAIALPEGTVGLVHPRSGLAAKHGLSVVNTPGTIDAQYRGEIKVCLINHDPENSIDITRGMRIAQLVIQRVELVDFVETTELAETERGTAGYGSTGTH